MSQETVVGVVTAGGSDTVAGSQVASVAVVPSPASNCVETR